MVDNNKNNQSERHRGKHEAGKKESLDMSSVLGKEKFFDINEIKNAEKTQKIENIDFKPHRYTEEDEEITLEPKEAVPVSKGKNEDADTKESAHHHKTVLYILFVLIASGILSYFTIVSANDIFALAKPRKDIVVTIPVDSGTSQIAKILKDDGVIKYPIAFTLYSKLKKNDGKYLSGNFNMNSSMDYSQIMSILKSKGDRTTVKFTILEGYDLKQIVKTLVKMGLGTEDKYWEVLEKSNFDYAFLKGIPKGKLRLEGFLFPDTYEVYADESEESIINRMLANFEKKFTDEYYTRTKKLNMTVNEVITLASIIEKEGADSDEFPIVSSVFHNRLNHPADFPYLQSCATVQYILPERKAVLSYDDISIDNPYNTYKYKGLPPGPIANPGLDAIKAALYPSDTSYYYFVVAKDGRHIFSKTFAEHQKAIKEAGNTSQGTGTVSK